MQKLFHQHILDIFPWDFYWTDYLRARLHYRPRCWYRRGEALGRVLAWKSGDPHSVGWGHPMQRGRSQEVWRICPAMVDFGFSLAEWGKTNRRKESIFCLRWAQRDCCTALLSLRKRLRKLPGVLSCLCQLKLLIYKTRNIHGGKEVS